MMKRIYLFFLCIAISGCAGTAVQKQREGAHLWQTIQQRDEEIIELKKTIAAQEAEIEEMKKKLGNFGVF
ncbi:MAG: hypothetical protein WC532_02630 [Candidatus Omnitrophota bacterium]